MVREDIEELVMNTQVAKVTRDAATIMIMTNEDQECIQDLRITDPRDDKERIEKTKGGLLEGSYHWILENSDFQQWRNDQQSRLLWVKGNPGKGKTMLLCGIINELKKLMAETDLLSYFFCQAADSRINTATAVLRGLMYLLVDQQPSLISHIRKKHDHAGKTLFQDPNAWFALTEIFTNILQDPNLSRTYLIIDALDECGVDLLNLLDFIVQMSSASPRVKWIVSSRNSPNIDRRLEVAGRKVNLSLELNAEYVSTAVSEFIRHRVSQLAKREKYDDETESAVRDYLSLHANGTFLWVALVCNNLANVPRWRTLSTLRALPPGLDSLYERMIRQIYDSEDVNICKRVLAYMAIVYRPITLKELTSFVEMLEDISDLESLGEIIRLCGSFLVILEDTVYFVHQSAKDFLLTEASHRIFPSGIEGVHYTIYSRSLLVMSRTLRRDMYGLRAPGLSIDQVKQPEPDPLAAVRYSCVYWVDHLCDWHFSRKANYDDDLQDGGIVDKFIRRKYIYWLEALSLLRSVSEGVLSMAKLESLLQRGAHASRLLDLVRDARRFVLYHKWAIENNPLQVYASAFVFSPARSLTRELFKEEEPEWITTKPAIEDDWSACLQTLEGHSDSVTSVAFSHDDKHVASASDDCTIKIWDTASGKCLQTLKGHIHSVSSVSFSPDGEQLASGSDDKTIRIWGTETGALKLMLEGHTHSVSSVAFSADGKRLGSGSDDKTVRIWDAKTGASGQTLRGHSNWVRSVAFSHDGKWLASGSLDRLVRIWDTETGALLKTLKDHKDSINSLRLSTDGKRLASGSDDKTIRIWDTKTGALKLMLEGHTHSVSSVAFSTDGKWLGSGSDDKTVRIWDAEAGKLQQTFDGHSHSVSSVMFSHDRKQLASGSLDHTVRIWDTETGALGQTLKGHSNWVRSVAFSHDGKRLASGSLDRLVRIWDTETGELQRTLKGHLDWVNSLAFANDGKQLASGSDDQTVRIWDAETGELQRTLKGHTDSVNSVAFAYVGKQLASGSDDKTLRIWDAENGELRKTLEGHTSLVYSVAYSHDEKWLASGSFDKTVRVWRTKTGELWRTFEGHTSWVRSVALSQDGRRLASSADDETVRIWDVFSGELLQTLRISGCLAAISFSSDGHSLATDRGSFALDGPSHSAQTPNWSAYCVHADRSWIIWKGNKILWIPPEYRPLRSLVRDRTVAIGCSSGRVLFIGFAIHIAPLQGFHQY